jgi:hypothetical protein
LYFEKDSKTLIPFRLKYLDPFPVSLVYLNNTLSIHQDVFGLSHLTYFQDARLELFSNMIRNRDASSPESQKLNEIEDRIQKSILTGRVARDSASAEDVEGDITSIGNRVWDLSLRYSPIAVQEIAHRLIPVTCTPYVEQSFMSEESLSIQDLIQGISGPAPIDIHVKPLKIKDPARTYFSPKSAQILAQTLSELSVTDFDIVYHFTRYGLFINRIYEDVVSRYQKVTHCERWNHDRERLISSLCIFIFHLKGKEWEANNQPLFIRVRLTFGEEAIVDFFDALDNADHMFLSIHIDLAFLSMCSQGITSGVSAF